MHSSGAPSSRSGVGLVITVITAILAEAIGYALGMTGPQIGALALSLLVLAIGRARLARVYAPYFRRRKTLSTTARERLVSEFSTMKRQRRTIRSCTIVAGLLALASLVLTVESESIRGANMDNPGVVFVLYNRVASPELAELIELYVVGDTPIEQASSRDLRILRNLYFAVEGYDFSAADLSDLFDGLIWYRPYRSYPNDIAALPASYQQRVRDIVTVEQSRQ